MKRGLFFIVIAILFVFAKAEAGEVEGVSSLVSICQIQGSGFTSPKVGQTIQTQGIVTADFDQESSKGFFIQAENCDDNPATSDGVFVFIDEKFELVSMGDLVEISGTVVENYGLTEIHTQPGNVQIISQGNALPIPVELAPPFDNVLARTYFETLEGMVVAVSLARVVGPTDSQDDTWIIRSDLGLDRVFRDDPAGTGEVISVSADGSYEIPSPAKVGDQLAGLHGVLGYSLGIYQMHLLTSPTFFPGEGAPQCAINSPEPGFTFGTFNLENLFDVADDPIKDDPLLSSTEYHRKLEKLALSMHCLNEPAFLAVQEAENDIVLNHLLVRTEIEADYEVVWLDGPDTRGIDVALLYRLDQVTVLNFEQRQGCTSLVDGLGPDGDRNVNDPYNAITCDTNGDGILDGNRLFSRPPLVVQLEVSIEDSDTLHLWVIVNHFKSKREDTSSQAYTLPRRVQQAQFVAGLVDEIESSHSGAAVVVLGDLNDYVDSQPLAILQQAGLWNTLLGAERSTRYTYIYQGISQVLDHVLVNSAFLINRVDAQPFHLNSDYAYYYRGQDGIFYRASDHDPVLVEYQKLTNRIYLPSIIR